MSATPTEFLPDDVDGLLALLEQDEARWAKLKALHGPYGKWTDARKAMLAVRKLEIRKDAPPAGAAKWTDDLLDTAGHADTEYRDLVDTAIADAEQFHLLDAKRERILIKTRSLTYNPVR